MIFEFRNMGNTRRTCKTHLRESSEASNKSILHANPDSHHQNTASLTYRHRGKQPQKSCAPG